MSIVGQIVSLVADGADFTHLRTHSNDQGQSEYSGGKCGTKDPVNVMGCPVWDVERPFRKTRNQPHGWFWLERTYGTSCQILLEQQ